MAVTNKKFGWQLGASADVNPTRAKVRAVRFVTSGGATACTLTVQGVKWLDAGVPATNNVLDIPMFDLPYDVGDIVLTTLGTNCSCYVILARSSS